MLRIYYKVELFKNVLTLDVWWKLHSKISTQEVHVSSKISLLAIVKNVLSNCSRFVCLHLTPTPTHQIRCLGLGSYKNNNIIYPHTRHAGFTITTSQPEINVSSIELRNCLAFKRKWRESYAPVCLVTSHAPSSGLWNILSKVIYVCRKLMKIVVVVWRRCLASNLEVARAVQC